MSNTPKKPATIDSLNRGIDLLEILAERDSVKLAALPELLDISRATAFRVLKTLQERGYVEHVAAQSAYRLGPAALLLSKRSQSVAIIRIARPVLQDLAQRTGETVNLAMFRAGRLVYVEIVDGRHALRMSASLGQAVPMHSTALGKAILALLSEERQGALLGAPPWSEYTPSTKTTWRELRTDVRRAASRGYALDLQEMDEGAVCVGAAIQGAGGEPLGGISVSGWAQRLGPKARTEIGESLSDRCRQISAELGYGGDGTGP
jgi:IclR family acetate operon transcriptional repressor